MCGLGSPSKSSEKFDKGPFLKTFDKRVNDPVKENVLVNVVPEVDSAKEEDVEEGIQASLVKPSHVSDKLGDDAQVVSSDDDSFWGFKSN
ncbi:unnamed protein product [Citrullus colocynthis]|uniref:Uncharacterized protein n=1 Tax=Citrullus colocynthis TaxID=252529 RepID=A0ABP0YZT1_9ROSI